MTGGNGENKTGKKTGGEKGIMREQEKKEGGKEKTGRWRKGVVKRKEGERRKKGMTKRLRRSDRHVGGTLDCCSELGSGGRQPERSLPAQGSKEPMVPHIVMATVPWQKQSLQRIAVGQKRAEDKLGTGQHCCTVAGLLCLSNCG